MKFSVQIRVINGVSILVCSGRLIYREEARVFSEKIGGVIVPGSCVVIEMTGVEAIDSAGLGELAVIHMWARAAGCSLKIVGVSGRIQRLFELTNLSSIFEVHATLDDVFGTFQGESLRAKVASSAA